MENERKPFNHLFGLSTMLAIRWHDEESRGYTDQIPLEWLARDQRLTKCLHDVVGPRSGHSQAKCDVHVQGRDANFDYRPYEDFNHRQGMLIGVMRIRFSDHDRRSVTQVFWKKKGERQFQSCSTTATFLPAEQDFESGLEKSMKLSPEERRARLATASRKPERVTSVITAFRRNPDVVAEILLRAQGFCDECKEPAPFQRAGTSEPYLEVHHRVRLADGGDDTIENAIAVCPNCHRKAHFG